MKAIVERGGNRYQLLHPCCCICTHLSRVNQFSVPHQAPWHVSPGLASAQIGICIHGYTTQEQLRVHFTAHSSNVPLSPPPSRNLLGDFIGLPLARPRIHCRNCVAPPSVCTPPRTCQQPTPLCLSAQSHLDTYKSGYVSLFHQSSRTSRRSHSGCIQEMATHQGHPMPKTCNTVHMWHYFRNPIISSQERSISYHSQTA